MSEEKLLRLCSKSEIEDQTSKRIILPEHDAIAVCRLGDKYYAVADTCSHGLASLSEGDIEDGQIYCPFHSGSFDIKTGAPVERPCTIAIDTYPVIEKGEDLFIEL
tara:strand:+ start:16665 stop:16982 length:318 start_codon:yes stop_codon:yes gene_type:complete